VRVVRTPAGPITIDATGRAPGRGAYLCNDPACWSTAGRKRALEHALRVSLPQDLVALLAAGPDVAVAIPEPTPRVVGALPGGPDAKPDTDEGESYGQE
jgi:hypothetical protein